MESNTNMDILLEKTSNIEEVTLKNKVRRAISNSLRVLAKREKNLRESTIMIKHSDTLSAKSIPEIVEKEWSIAHNKPTVTSWQDKDYVYIQFADWSTKQLFLDFAAMGMPSNFIAAIQPPVSMTEHMVRRPVKVIINNVRAAYRTEHVKTGLVKTLPEGSLIEFKEHKANAVTKARNIEFHVNEMGFRFLFATMDGVLPYFGLTLNQKTRLSLRVFCKPWACRDCFSFGFHQCGGKICANCSGPQHSTKDCTKKLKYCRNCKRSGHRPRDAHCETYLLEVAKEIRKYAIPIDFFEDSEMRFNLTKHLQFT